MAWTKERPPAPSTERRSAPREVWSWLSRGLLGGPSRGSSWRRASRSHATADHLHEQLELLPDRCPLSDLGAAEVGRHEPVRRADENLRHRPRIARYGDRSVSESL